MARDRAHYYTVLGLAPDAPRDAVKKAFRGLAQELHPDVTDEPDAADRFREIVEAYEALSRPLRSELRERARERPRPPAPRRVTEARTPELRMGFLEAQRGGRVHARIRLATTCTTCRGEGRAPWATPERCPRCDGDGWVRDVSTSARGRWIQVEACPDCAGAGVVISQPCVACAGEGSVESDVAVTLDVPPGTADGTLLEARVLGASSPSRRVEVQARVEPAPQARLLRVVSLCGIAAALILLIFMLRPL